MMRPSTSSFFKLPPALYMRTGTIAWTRTGMATRGAAIVVLRTMLEVAGRVAARAAERRIAVRNMMNRKGRWTVVYENVAKGISTAARESKQFN